ncbi:ABC transporter substrate-binding protein, partial [Pseudomonas shirazensis]
LFMNSRRATFSDPQVRQALGLMLDFEWTNRALFSSAYRRSTSYYPNSEFAASGLPTGKEWLLLAPFRDELPAKLYTEPYQVSHTDGSGVSRQTLRKALTLLDKAGWKLDGQRLVDAKGKQFQMELLLVNPNLERILQPYVENLASIGIDARLRTVDRAQYKQRLDQFDF